MEKLGAGLILGTGRKDTMRKSGALPIEVIIPCHNPERPIHRAVASVINGNSGIGEVTVVCHNTSPKKIETALGTEMARAVRLIECADGVHSPAGPMNAGLANARSPWVSFLGSDDSLAPDALSAWLQVAKGTDAVIAREHFSDGRAIRTPVHRLLPRRFADPIRDRLFYRSAPLGLLRTAFLQKHNLAFTPGLPTGEDIALTSQIWATGKVRAQTFGPGYMVGEDATDRVTTRSRSAAEALAFIPSVWDQSWLQKWPPRLRDALGTAHLRLHVFGWANAKINDPRLFEGDQEVVSNAIKKILELAPGALLPMSARDRNLIDALLDQQAPFEEILSLAQKRRKFYHPGSLFTRDLANVLAPDAPLRFSVASALIR